MNTFNELEKEINTIKELNQEAGNLLHTQLHNASNSEWSREDLSELLKSENDAVDLLDNELLAFEEMQNTVRNIQDGIINFFGE